MIRLTCGCKINLGLKITGKRADGFHDLDSVFCPLQWPRDELRITGTGRQGAGIFCDANIAGENILARTLAIFGSNTGIFPNLRLDLCKRIPVGAGLGGGSANAALLLRWLNDTCGRPLSDPDMLELALDIGSDVPFFLINRPCRLRGRGGNLEPLALAGWFLVLVWPGIHVSTRDAFAAYDAMRSGKDCGDHDARQNFLTNGYSKAKDSSLFAGCPQPDFGVDGLWNDLEAPVFAMYPALGSLKAAMLALGACAAAMSGSGSAIYGLFDNNNIAAKAWNALGREYPATYLVALRNCDL